MAKKKIETINIPASVQQNDELPENPLLMNAITSSIQPKEGTMSTLYGNEIAFNYAQENTDINYPPGTVLYEVTWKQRPDQVWFGGNIPKSIYSVERIVFNYSGVNYEKYQGKPLRLVTGDIGDKDSRKNFIISQKMAVSP
ncbi:hypothetical protein [Chryseobacterium wanjuense]